MVSRAPCMHALEGKIKLTKGNVRVANRDEYVYAKKTFIKKAH